MNASLYICFEGIDGSGKSRQMSTLSAYLTERGITPICLYEPSYGAFGREIRHRVANGTIGNIDAQRELFTADRYDHVERKVRPLLQFVRNTPGFVILQSRCYISAAAYQATADDDASLDAILRGQEAFAPAPDLILVLDLPVRLAMERLKRRGVPDAFESLETLKHVRLRYTRIVGIRSRCVLVDAVGDPELVASRIRNAISLPEEERA
jgi:dTMP kinase